jgi:hypothetical protein
MTEFITKEEAEALIEVAYKAAFEDVYSPGAGAIALQNAINLSIAQKFEARAWGGVFAKIDGEWSLQFPLFGSQHMAKESLKDYADDVLLEVRPLYALKGDSK